jgi:hypothetical protein
LPGIFITVVNYFIQENSASAGDEYVIELISVSRNPILINFWVLKFEPKKEPHILM